VERTTRTAPKDLPIQAMVSSNLRAATFSVERQNLSAASTIHRRETGNNTVPHRTATGDPRTMKELLHDLAPHPTSTATPTPGSHWSNHENCCESRYPTRISRHLQRSTASQKLDTSSNSRDSTGQRTMSRTHGPHQPNGDPVPRPK
jgi:hypothetical protein